MAHVWAAATDARDGRATPASLADAREPILAAMTDPGAIAVVVEEEEQVVAFAVATTASPPDEREAEVRFVGVAPNRRREGLGERIMAALVSGLRRQGHDAARLLVYVDNRAAIALYQRCGWVASSERPSVHPRSGRLEQRYRLELAAGTME